jgi:hypothetical protein
VPRSDQEAAESAKHRTPVLSSAGARKSRRYKGLALPFKNGPFPAKCCPNFISFACNDLQSERAEKLDNVCHNEIMYTCL